VREANGLGLSRQFEVDAAGQLRGVVDRNGRRRAFDYDLDGRRTAERWLDGSGGTVRQISYQWDAASQLVGASDPDQTYSFRYDVLGWVTGLDNAGSPAIYPHVVLRNSYDANSNRTFLRDNYGTEWRYVYDGLNRLTQATLVVGTATKAVAQFTYDAAGRLTELKRHQPGTSSGSAGDPFIKTVYSYDGASRVTGIGHEHVSSTGTVTPLAEFLYTWDGAWQMVQYGGPEGVRNYRYDPQGQLTDVRDGAGNLIEY
jgi:YD repeat-containing protein